MKAKLNRGPMNNKRVEVDQFQNEVLVGYTPREAYFDFLLNPVDQVPVKRGTYRRSNAKLKDGTPVFEWMGWLG